MSKVQAALQVLNQTWSRRGATAATSALLDRLCSVKNTAVARAASAAAAAAAAALVSSKQQIHRMMRQGKSNQQYPYTTSSRQYPYSASKSSNGCFSLAGMVISSTAATPRHMSSWMFATTAGPRSRLPPSHQHNQHNQHTSKQQQPLVYLDWKKSMGPACVRWKSSNTSSAMATATTATSTLSNNKNAVQSSGSRNSSSSTGSSSSTNTNTTNTNTTNTTNNSNLFLDNMGTIFLTAIGGIVAWLVRSYLNSQAQTNVRQRIEATAVVDPIELHDVQVANRHAIMAVSSLSGLSNNTVEPVLSPTLFLQLVQTVRDKQQPQQQPQQQQQPHLASNGGTGIRMTYPDFVAAVRAAWPDAVLAATGAIAKSTTGTLEMGHILDRIALSLVMKHQESSMATTINSNSDSSNASAASSLGNRQHSTREQHLLQTTALPIQQWWTLVSLALSPSEKDTNGSGSDNCKIRALYQMMQLLKEMPHEHESNDPTVTIATIATTVLTMDDVIELVQYLQDSFQLAPDAQIVMDPAQQVAFPLQSYTVGTPEQLVRIAHVANNSTKSTSKDDTPLTTMNTADDVATKHATTDRIDVDTCAAILTSRSVCAWGECYRKTKRR